MFFFCCYVVIDRSHCSLFDLCVCGSELNNIVRFGSDFGAVTKRVDEWPTKSTKGQGRNREYQKHTHTDAHTWTVKERERERARKRSYEVRCKHSLTWNDLHFFNESKIFRGQSNDICSVPVNRYAALLLYLIFSVCLSLFVFFRVDNCQYATKLVWSVGLHVLSAAFDFICSVSIVT